MSIGRLRECHGMQGRPVLGRLLTGRLSRQALSPTTSCQLRLPSRDRSDGGGGAWPFMASLPLHATRVQRNKAEFRLRGRLRG